MKKINCTAFSLTRIDFFFSLIAMSFILLPAKNIYAQDGTDFKFKLGITYNISTGDKDKQKDAHKLAMWFSDGDYSGMAPAENNAVFIVFDMKAMKMLTVMEEQKMVMSMDLSKYQQQAQQGQNSGDKTEPKAKPQIIKTGVTEKILGYTCDQYKITSEKSESLIWVTTELGSGFSNFSKSLMMALNNGRGGKPGNTTLPDTEGAANGIMLKMVATDLSSNKVTTLEATDVNKDGKELNTSGYKVMSM